ncbi:hypothetical protein [Streptomyces albipurpureus]|uniref:Uncharacterized protein n=1 Tax=Streptomyces albipurpureus TaxID=2897419 RepID=A0ABT0UI85_9ACTN|nr:hypothetical protein [Streptomyces sp. CWNU-1]MCM2388140.1 hypothetical protein [Streptomyces sp. CWNU-1]
MADTDFPHDLRDAQARLHQTRAAYEELCRTLPCSVEPAGGWEGDKQLHSDRRSGTPTSPGNTDQQKEEKARLRDLLLELSTILATHEFWQTLRGPGWVAARMELKQNTPRACCRYGLSAAPGPPDTEQQLETLRFLRAPGPGPGARAD